MAKKNTFKLKNVTAVNNRGAGIAITGYDGYDFEFEDIYVANNAGGGIVVNGQRLWTEVFGLHPETSPREFAELLRGLKDKGQTERQSLLGNLIPKWMDRIANLTEFAANDMTVTGMSSLPVFIDALLNMARGSK